MNWYLYHVTPIGNMMPLAVAPTQKLHVYSEVFGHHQDELIQRWIGLEKQLTRCIFSRLSQVDYNEKEFRIVFRIFWQHWN